MISPFVAGYVLEEPPRRTRLLECQRCSFRYFEERFSEDEVNRLYRGYRGAAYFDARHRVEPWYTRSLNDRVGSDPLEIQTRKHLAGQFIRGHLGDAQIRSLLDYGGDRGQFIPDGLAVENYVFDISEVEAEPGITPIASEDTLREHRFDLIMLCHVLEHLSEPSQVLQQLRGLASPVGTYYFIEVPYERYAMPFSRDLPLIRGYIDFAARLPQRALTMLDFYSTAIRVRFGVVPPFGFPKLTEHINFFDSNSITALLERCGFSVIGCRIASEAKTTVGFQGTLLCLARAAAG